MKTAQTLAVAGVIILIAIFTVACDKGSTGSTTAGELKNAPDFKLEKVGGGMVKLSEYKGNIIILDFWATWCPPCIKEIPDFVELQKEYGAKGLVILGISLDQNTKKALPPFMKKYKINYPILLTDGKVDKAYGGVSGIPTTFVIDQKGAIYKQYVGFRPKQVFESDIKALLN